MRIVVHEFGGHAFALQLSRHLAKRGHEVQHIYCASIPTTPQAAFAPKADDPRTLEIMSVRMPRSLRKTALFERWRLERRYGRDVVAALRRWEPELVVSATTPLDAQEDLLNYCKRSAVPFVFWVQDLIGEASYRILPERLPVIGRMVGAYYSRKEKALLQRSDHVIGITEDFEPYFRAAGVPAERWSVIRNWAPAEEIVAASKHNHWSQKFGLADKFVFLYSGTLGFKHNPALLLALAQYFRGRDGVKIVVNSQGEGADWLKVEAARLSLQNLLVNPYQPFEHMSAVLASADVLVGILEPAAGVFSVPSKVLAYQCAARPLLLAVPGCNLAAKLVMENGTGLVSAPDDVQSFCRNAERLYHSRAMRVSMGRAAAEFAREAFDIESITNRFEEILVQLRSHVPGAGRARGCP